MTIEALERGRIIQNEILKFKKEIDDLKFKKKQIKETAYLTLNSYFHTEIDKDDVQYLKILFDNKIAKLNQNIDKLNKEFKKLI